VQTRIVQCVNQYGMVVDEGKCSSSGQLTRPQAARDCCLESPLYPGQCVGYIPTPVPTPVPTEQPSAAPTDFPTFTDAPTVITRPPTGTPTRAFPLCATANLASPFNDITEGLITFYQAYYGAPTQVTLKVVGSVGTVGGGKSFGEYHIHEFAVNPNDPNGPCSVTSVGGHYNPTNIADYKLCNPNVPSTCEVGDLSGKFGLLQGSFEERQFSDPSLDLAAILQRSVVIHDARGDRWVCATIFETDPIAAQCQVAAQIP
jgi:Cu/Zn superoxide dismutase